MSIFNCVCFVFAYYMLMAVVCVNANVVLMGKSVSKSFDDAEANFTPKIKVSGESGILYLADPLDACFPLMKKMDESTKSPFALIVRGGCAFDDKIRNAQSAGFKAAIVYDSEEKTTFLVEMAGNPDDINIHAVLISKDSGKELLRYSNNSNFDIWILPAPAASKRWSVSFIILFGILALVAMLYFGLHKSNDWQEMDIEAVPDSPAQEFQGMSCRLVKAMPSLIFSSVSEDKSTSITCAICLEDYCTRERVHILPCGHKFHAKCVDSWPTSCKTFCPVCKRDARTVINIPPASESSPLLSSASSSSLTSTINLQSYHSSLPTSPLSMPITSRNRLFSTPRFPNTYMSYYVTSNLAGTIYRHSFNDIHSSSNASPDNFVNTLSSRSFGLPTSSRFRSETFADQSSMLTLFYPQGYRDNSKYLYGLDSAISNSNGSNSSNHSKSCISVLTLPSFKPRRHST